jgi:hypothetical protein
MVATFVPLDKKIVAIALFRVKYLYSLCRAFKDTLYRRLVLKEKRAVPREQDIAQVYLGGPNQRAGKIIQVVKNNPLRKTRR